MIQFSCTGCTAKFRVKDDFAGRKTRCPTCKKVLSVPAPDKTAESVFHGGSVGTRGGVIKAAKLVSGGVTLDTSSSSSSSSSKKSVPEILSHSSGGDDRYTLESEIARGGMGAVLRAVDRDIRREVAVKYLLDQKDTRKKHRFVEEAQITGQLEHPNIVPIHELGVDQQNRLFFSMKMVHGRSLGQILDELRKSPARAEREFPLSKLLTIFVGVCNALAYAHARKVIHRDLKPANIMVGEYGEVYVMDWGLAKVLREGANSSSTVADSGSFDFTAEPSPGSSSGPTSSPSGGPISGTSSGTKSGAKVDTSREAEADLTQEGAVMGTPLYMSPEQAKGDVDNTDCLSDIYSLGAILYELIVLAPPIDKAGGHMSILMRVAQGEIQPPEKANPERVKAGKVPKEILAIAMKAMAKNPVKRYKNVESLRHDIELFQEGKAVSAKQDSVREAVWKLIKRNKAASVTALIAFVILNGIMAFAVQQIWAAKKRAENALVALEQEHKDKRTRGRKSAAMFIQDARQSADKRNLEYAVDQVTVALDFDPDNLEGRLLRAQLAIVRREFAAAIPDLEWYVKQTSPSKAIAQEMLQLCKGAKADDPNISHQFAESFIRQKLYGFAEQMELDDDMRIRGYKKRLDDAWPDQGKRLYVQNKKLRLDLSNNKMVSDLTPLQGMPLDALNLTNCSQVRDLRPLFDMPLTELIMPQTPVRDLTPIQNAPLTKLNIGYCNEISSVVPLKGKKITELYLSGCKQLTDLSPLKGMPVSTLWLVSCDHMKDLEPLRGMPISKLHMANIFSPRDMSFTKDMPLAYLDLSGSSGLRDISFLKGMSQLAELNLHNCSNLQDLAPLEGLKLTRLSLPNSPRCTDLSPLRGMPLNALAIQGCKQIENLGPLAGMNLESVTIRDNDKIEDLSAFKGQKITTLNLTNCTRIRDLSPLAGMPLGVLDLEYCPRIDDLSPLKGMDIKTLDLFGCTAVKDATPLAESSFNLLDLRGTQVADLKPLAGARIGELCVYPKAGDNLDMFRGNKTLRSVCVNIGPSRTYIPAMTFWKRYDAGDFK